MNDDPYASAKTSTTADLEARWRRFGVHRASRAATPETWSTGWPGLDALLPGGGYPLAAVTEFLVERPGSGELSLLLAALKPQLAAYDDARLVFIDPPYPMNAPAFDAAGIDRSRVPILCCGHTGARIWSVEQLAAIGGLIAFVLWDDNLDMAELRRLQLAAEKAGCPVFVYRDLGRASQRSPAALRLAVTCRNARQRIEIIKCRGPAGARTSGLAAGRDVPWAGTPGETNTPPRRAILRPADNEPSEARGPGVDDNRPLSHQTATRFRSRAR